MSYIRVALAVVAALLAGCAPKPVSLRIAAAADLRFALDDLVKNYAAQHPGVHIQPTYGASGMFFAQLLNQAPFDLFLSADVQYPRQLTAKGLTLPGSDFTYAFGHLVLWTANPQIDIEHIGMDVLRQPAVRHIAIANPAHAPYGRAAESALRSLGLYDAVKDKLVTGENISQTFQLAQSGAADVGLVALSLAISPNAGGSYVAVPAAAYPRIEQGGAIMKSTKNVEAAQAFRAFLLSPEGRAILKRYGFSAD